MRQTIAVVTLFVVLGVCSLASAQGVVYETYSPVVVQSPVVVDAWRPVVTNYGYSPPVSTPSFTSYSANYGNYGAAVSYYAPPVTAYSPVVTESVTAYSPAVTAYSPVTTTYAPVTTYRPVVTYSPVVRSYYTPYVVTPRYVPGQPVRNFFRAMGP
ncbi:MAG TPA: hypothetical protein VHC22_06230 [Pirellulales bacterium]|nr:hypothetical protein [Pirellulales bacterium]